MGDYRTTGGNPKTCIVGKDTPCGHKRSCGSLREITADKGDPFHVPQRDMGVVDNIVGGKVIVIIHRECTVAEIALVVGRISMGDKILI